MKRMSTITLPQRIVASSLERHDCLRRHNNRSRPSEVLEEENSQQEEDKIGKPSNQLQSLLLWIAEARVSNESLSPRWQPIIPSFSERKHVVLLAERSRERGCSLHRAQSAEVMAFFFPPSHKHEQ
jgi:hypothetical protein